MTSKPRRPAARPGRPQKTEAPPQPGPEGHEKVDLSDYWDLQLQNGTWTKAFRVLRTEAALILTHHLVGGQRLVFRVQYPKGESWVNVPVNSLTEFVYHPPDSRRRIPRARVYTDEILADQYARAAQAEIDEEANAPA